MMEFYILSKLNLENFKITHLKVKNFKILYCYNFSNFVFWSSNFQYDPKKLQIDPLLFSKIIVSPLKFFEIYKLTPNLNVQIWPKKLKIIKVS